MAVELSSKMSKLLIHIFKKGFVTKNTRPFLTTLRYYNYIWLARDAGLIVCNGTNSETHEKTWILTERGAKVASLLKKVEDELNEVKSDNI